MSLKCVLVEYKECDRGFHLIFVEEILKPKLTEELALKIGVDLFNGWVKEKIQEIEYELVNE